MVCRDAARKLDITLTVKNSAEIWAGEQLVPHKALLSPASPAFELIILPFFLYFYDGSEAGDTCREKQAMWFFPSEAFL